MNKPFGKAKDREDLVKRFASVLEEAGLKPSSDSGSSPESSSKYYFKSAVGRGEMSLDVSPLMMHLYWRWNDDDMEAVLEKMEQYSLWNSFTYNNQSLMGLNKYSGKWNWMVNEGNVDKLDLFFSQLKSTLAKIGAKPVNSPKKIPLMVSTMDHEKFLKSVNLLPKKRRRKKMKPIMPRKPSAEDSGSPFRDTTRSDSMRGVLAILYTAAFMDKTKKPVSQTIIQDFIPRWLEDASAAIYVDHLPLSFQEIEKLCVGIKAGKIEGDAYASIGEIGKDILQIDKAARHNMEFSERDLDMLSSVGGYYRNRSPSSWDRVFRSVDLLNIIELSVQFIPDNVSTTEVMQLKKELRGLVAQLIKNPDKGQYLLTFQQANEFKVGHKKRGTYEKYMETQRKLRALWNQAALAILRRFGKPVPVKQFLQRLKEDGVLVNYVPKGFNAKIGINGKKIELFTNDDRPIQGWPQRGRAIVMNNQFGSQGANQYVFKAVDDETGLESSYYTYDHHQSSRTEKFKVVEVVMDNIESYQTKWEAPLKAWSVREKPTMEILQSAQAIFMYECQARIGGKGNKTDGKATYGVTTWKVGHIKKLTSDELVILYSGKKGVKQKHTIKATNPLLKKLVALVKQLSQGRGKNDMLWIVPGKLSKNHASAALFRQWLKSIGFPSTPHKLRHAKGTKIARELIQKRRFTAPEGKSKDVQYREATKFFKEQIATAVAKALGHKSATGEALYLTSVKSYIDPSVSRGWFTDRGYRPPSWIPKTDE